MSEPRTILTGTETETLELDGTLPASARDVLAVPAPLELDAGPVAVNALWFAMRGLHVRGVPWPRFDYREVLWRISVRIAGEPAWFAITCDLDSALIRGFGRRVVRYPTRVAAFGAPWTVTTAAGELAVEISDERGSPDPIAPRRTFVRGSHVADLYEIPWRELPAPERHDAHVTIATDTLSRPTFGADARVAWASAGVVHRGRTHSCGIARRVTTAS